MSVVISTCLYIIVYLLSAFFISVGVKRRTGRRLLIILGVLIPSVFAGIRYDVGTDWSNYLTIYKYAESHSLSEYFSWGIGNDIGTWIFAKIGSLLGGYQGFFFLYAFAMLSIAVYMLYRQYPNIPIGGAVFCFLLGTFTAGLNIMRQSLAACIVLFGMKYIFEKKLAKYVVTVIFATAIHLSAVFCLPIYFIWNQRKENVGKIKKIVIYVGISICVIFLPYLLQMISGIQGLDRFAEYAEDSVSGSNKRIILNGIMLVVILIARKRLESIDSRNRFLVVLLVIGFLLEFLGFYSPYMKRINLYFTIPEFLVLMQMPNLFVIKDRWIVKLSICLYSLMIFILTYWILGQSGVLPYQVH